MLGNIPESPVELLFVGMWASDDLDAEPWWPDPQRLVDEAWERDRRGKITGYLEAGKVCTQWMGYSHCRFKGCRTPNKGMGTCDLTDGVWAWPQGLAHYMQHDVRLPDAFVEHMASNGFEVPDVPWADPMKTRAMSTERVWLEWTLSSIPPPPPEPGALDVTRAQALADEYLGDGRATLTEVHGRWRYAVDDAKPLHLPPQNERSLARRLWQRSWPAAEYALSLDDANALAKRLCGVASLRVNAVHPLPGTPFGQWVVDWKLRAGPWTEARLIIAEDEPGFRLWLEWLEEDASSGTRGAVTPAIFAAQQKYSIANR